jgi:hypothetical protein
MNTRIRLRFPRSLRSLRLNQEIPGPPSGPPKQAFALPRIRVVVSGRQDVFGPGISPAEMGKSHLHPQGRLLRKQLVRNPL